MNKTKNITNEIVTEYMNQFYQSPDPRLLKLRQQAENRNIPIILRETEDFFGVLLSIVQPKRILEIGTAVGYSAAYFAIKTGGQVVTIERDPQFANEAAFNIEELGLKSQIRLIQGDGVQSTIQLAAQGEADFDLVFIDAAKSHYKAFLDGALPLCHEGTVILSDNVLFRGRVASDIYDPDKKHKTSIRQLREYVEYIYSHPRLQTSVIACGDGVAISRVKGEEHCHC